MSGLFRVLLAVGVLVKFWAMSETTRIWVKELTGLEMSNIPGLIANGYAVYMSAMDDTQGWRIRDVASGANPFEAPTSILFVEDVHHSRPVQPAEKVRVYIVGGPDPWAAPAA